MSQALGVFLNCCERVLQGDKALLEQLRAAGFECQAAYWSFRLPALHAFLLQQLGEQCPDYPTFRRQLFASDCNQQLQGLGAAIVIADNRGKVDESLYALRLL